MGFMFLGQGFVPVENSLYHTIPVLTTLQCLCSTVESIEDILVLRSCTLL